MIRRTICSPVRAMIAAVGTMYTSGSSPAQWIRGRVNTQAENTPNAKLTADCLIVRVLDSTTLNRAAATMAT